MTSIINKTINETNDDNMFTFEPEPATFGFIRRETNKNELSSTFPLVLCQLIISYISNADEEIKYNGMTNAICGVAKVSSLEIKSTDILSLMQCKMYVFFCFFLFYSVFFILAHKFRFLSIYITYRNKDTLQKYMEKSIMFRENKNVFVISNESSYTQIERIILFNNHNDINVEFEWFQPNEIETKTCIMQRFLLDLKRISTYYMNKDKLNIFITKEILKLEKRVKNEYEINKFIEEDILFPTTERVEVLTINIDQYQETDDTEQISIDLKVKYKILKLEYLPSMEAMEENKIYVGIYHYLDVMNEVKIKAKFIELIDKEMEEYRVINTSIWNTTIPYKVGICDTFEAIYNIEPMKKAQTHFKQELQTEIEQILTKCEYHQFKQI